MAISVPGMLPWRHGGVNFKEGRLVGCTTITYGGLFENRRERPVRDGHRAAANPDPGARKLPLTVMFSGLDTAGPRASAQRFASTVA